MKQQTKLKLDLATETAKKGDSYKQQANYESASHCYLKVSKILTLLLNDIDNPNVTTELNTKIQKYTTLANQTLGQSNRKINNNFVISKLGFPSQETPPTVTFIKKEEPNKKVFQKPKRQDWIIEPEVEGLVCRNLKHSFQDLVGMKSVKQALYEAVILPQKRPDLFQGIRTPPKGVLLYGPPGNGKTFVVKALAKQSGCVFYQLSAGSIVNKFVGQSEKMLKKVFESAKKTKPSIIFIDEIDSIITARTQGEQDSTRRLKTQFLIQFDSIEPSDNVIMVGATNFPGQIDRAALRRFNKMIYIDLPDKQNRQGVINNNLKDINSEISKDQMEKLVDKLDGYSISEIQDIVKEACMFPIREIQKDVMEQITKSKIRGVNYEDFIRVIDERKPLLTKQDLKKFKGNFQ